MTIEVLPVAKRLLALRSRIDEACRRANRQPHEVRLVGASKRQPTERLLAAYKGGLRVFGENQVQEALAHSAALPADVDWQLIGPLQSNKARKAATLFSSVHSIDRPKIARVLDRQAAEENKVLDGFLEINLGNEETKHGFSPDDLPEGVAALAGLEHLRIVGLMAIPPFAGDKEESRRWFRQLRQLRDELFSSERWESRPGYLSMGMSGDFDVAVEEGATHIRIGTALFGPRDR
jgi:pyridoxal phosphate enzyme (YggS family)